MKCNLTLKTTAMPNLLNAAQDATEQRFGG